jgi:hypothetical protein
MFIGFWRRGGGGGRLEVNKSTAEKRELFPIYSITSMHHRLTNYRKQRKLEEVIVVAFQDLKMSRQYPFFCCRSCE